MAEAGFTHLDGRGQARMVDVGDRDASNREAAAEGRICMSRPLFERLRQGEIEKGDVLAVARLAALQAAKRTWELVPLCHPIPIHGVRVEVELDDAATAVVLRARVHTHARTGVEMEALTAVMVGLLTVYDMAKSFDPGMVIGPVRLLCKDGGRHGPWQAEQLTDHG